MKISNPEKLNKKIAKVEAKSYKKTSRLKRKEELRLAKKSREIAQKICPQRGKE